MTGKLEATTAALAETRKVSHDYPPPRYLGFEQTGNVRVYSFERVSPGETTKTFTVTADLALFRKHHVGMQEGPALCLGVLASQLQALDSPEPGLLHAVTDHDMLVYLLARGTVASKKFGAKAAAKIFLR